MRLHLTLKLGCFLIASILLAASPLVCRADDASVTGVGGSVEMLGQHPTIRMVEERVTITNPEIPM